MSLRFRPQCVLRLVVSTLLLLSINCSKEVPLPPQVSSQSQGTNTTNFKALRKFSGRGDQHTKALHISGSSVRLVGRCWGSLDNTYTSFELKENTGNVTSGSSFVIHTEGLENGRGELVVSKILPGNYLISVTTNMNWEVVVYEGN
jgi:hypothetical protein